MTEEEELRAKIAAIAGTINEEKQRRQQAKSYYSSPPHTTHQYAPHGSYYRSRWSPYGRGGRAGYQPYHNRTLVLGGQQSSPPPPSATAPVAASFPALGSPDASLVSARRPGIQQLMNQNTFQREQKYQESVRAAKRQKIDLKERNTVMQHVKTSPASGSREVIVDGLRFQLREDGSKLVRIHDASTNHRPTPKKFILANVDFCRTKGGNLIRTNAVRDLLATAPAPQCEQFTKHGKCDFGATCNFSHDPNKVAMCKTFLHTGHCAAGTSCDLSHNPTYHRVPACTYFLRGNCVNDTCPYPHVRVSESAPVCRAFSTLFYCSLGGNCPKRHLFVCADYANHGKCDNANCSLPHPDRASMLRKVATRNAKTGSKDESDVSSDDEDQRDDNGIDDVDSDAAEEIIMGADGYDHALTQQQDFIAFD